MDLDQRARSTCLVRSAVIQYCDGQLLKFNDNHDERGRFSEGDGTGASSRMKSTDDIVSRVVAQAAATGVKTNLSKITLCASSADEKDAHLPKGDLAAYHNGSQEIVVATRVSDSIREVLKSGTIENIGQLTAMKILNHEITHAQGPPCSDLNYATTSGRVLEEGMTEAIAQRTLTQFTQDMGLARVTGPDMHVSSEGRFESPAYRREVEAVDTLTSYLSKSTGKSPVSYLKDWKFQTPPQDRIRTIASDLMGAAKLPDDQKKAVMWNLKVALGGVGKGPNPMPGLLDGLKP
jgi:hypothetical protein